MFVIGKITISWFVVDLELIMALLSHLIVCSMYIRDQIKIYGRRKINSDDIGYKLR